MYVYIVLIENEDGLIESIDSCYTSYEKAENRMKELSLTLSGYYAVVSECSLFD